MLPWPWIARATSGHGTVEVLHTASRGTASGRRELGLLRLRSVVNLCLMRRYVYRVVYTYIIYYYIYNIDYNGCIMLRLYMHVISTLWILDATPLSILAKTCL